MLPRIPNFVDLRPSKLSSLASHGLTALAVASAITISNAGFEELYFGSNLPASFGGDVPAGSFPTGPAPAGWSAYYEGGAPLSGTFIGVLNPGTAAQHAPNPAYFDVGASEGMNAVLLFTSGDGGGLEYGVEQDLGAVLEPEMRYRLSVQVGNIASGTALVAPYSNQGFFNLDGFPGYRLQLLANGVVIAEDVDSIRPAEGEWLQATLEFKTKQSHPRLGQQLGIRLVNRNQPEVVGVSGIEVDFDDVQLDASPHRIDTSLQPPPLSPLILIPTLLLGFPFLLLLSRIWQAAR
jgi:hypothetical protein